MSNESSRVESRQVKSGQPKWNSSLSPQMAFGLIALGITAAAALLLYVWLGWDVYWLWLVAINVVTYFFYRIDKGRAEHKPDAMRIPEVVLLWLTLLGGFVGAAFGMYKRPRHKTKHTKFKVALFAGAAIQAVILYFLYLR